MTKRRLKRRSRALRKRIAREYTQAVREGRGREVLKQHKVTRAMAWRWAKGENLGEPGRPQVPPAEVLRRVLEKFGK